MSYGTLETIDLNGELFIRCCACLECMSIKRSSQWQVDGMSGSFKYPDEVPVLIGVSHELTLAIVALLRYLWAYRKSMVVGCPRTELEPIWRRAKEIAPNWVGFAEERCLPVAMRIADKCDVELETLTLKLELLDSDNSTT